MQHKTKSAVITLVSLQTKTIAAPAAPSVQLLIMEQPSVQMVHVILPAIMATQNQEVAA